MVLESVDGLERQAWFDATIQFPIFGGIRCVGVWRERELPWAGVLDSGCTGEDFG
jgi:hypothetical protein